MSVFRRAFHLSHGHRDAEADVSEEVEFHLARRTEELMARGLPAHLARTEALRAFGDVPGIREELSRISAARVARRSRAEWMSGIAGDARYAVRSLGREPIFALMALLTLALGIGATSAVFSIVNGVLLQPLPYPDPDALVQVEELNTRGKPMDWAGANFNEVRGRVRTLSRLAVYSGGPTTVLGADQPLRAAAYGVSGGFFRLLGVPVAVGRTFAPEVTTKGREAVIVSAGFWRHALGSDPDFQHRLLRIEGRSYPVVGVMPDGFAFPADAELWFSAVDDNPHRTAHNWSGIGRLARGRTEDQARAELGTIMREIKAREGGASDAVGIYIENLHSELAPGARTSILLLQGAVGFVLLLACVNLANANLARGENRHREFAVRAALGAGRGRLARLLLMENLLLGVTGGILGVGVSYWLIRLALSGSVETLPAFADIRLRLPVIAFTTILAVLSGGIVGLLPAWHAARTDLKGAMNDGGRTTAGPRRRHLRRVLVATQVALALTLLVGAGLLVQSLRTLLQVEPGFETQNV